MKITLRELINYVAIFVIFSTGLTFAEFLPFADLRISYLIMAFVFLLWLPFLKGLYFNRTFIFLFIVVIIFSLYNSYTEKNSLSLLTKQIIGILSTSFIFYTLIKVNKSDIRKLFRIYLNLAFLVGLIGLIQELSYLLGFKPGYDFSYILPSWRLSLSRGGFLRVNSIMSEPASFCYSMMPAFFISLTSFSKNNFGFMKKWKSLIIILSVFLSMSSIGYIGAVFSLALLFYNYGKLRHLIMGAMVTFVLMFVLYNVQVDFKMRVDDSINVISGKTSLETTNLSVFSLFSNALVTYNNFRENPIFGSGLGSHEISYNRYIGKVVDLDKVSLLLNRKDAGSLFLRLLSETGLFGLFVVFYFIFKFHLLKKDDKSNYLWIISNAILAMFVIRLIRSGHYFVNGFFFFVWVYYFAGRSKYINEGKS